MGHEGERSGEAKRLGARGLSERSPDREVRAGCCKQRGHKCKDTKSGACGRTPEMVHSDQRTVAFACAVARQKAEQAGRALFSRALYVIQGR